MEKEILESRLWKYSKMSLQKLKEEAERLVEFKNSSDDKKREEYNLVKTEIREREEKEWRARRNLTAKLLNGDVALPTEIFVDEIIENIPENAIPYLIDHGFDNDVFEKFLAEEGMSLILLLKMETITEKEIHKIRHEQGVIYLSICLKSGNVVSVKYEDTMSMIKWALDDSLRSHDLAENKLTMGREERKQNIVIYGKERFELTPTHKKKWKLEMQVYDRRLQNFKRLNKLLWQKVEKWKAMDWSQTNPTSLSLGEIGALTENNGDGATLIGKEAPVVQHKKEKIPKLKDWDGTVTELADEALNAYKKKKFRNLKKACKDFAMRYLIDEKPINETSLYTLASDIQRDERKINKNKQS